MALTTKQLAVALYQALSDTPDREVPAVIDRFFNLLAQRHMFSKAERVIADFQHYAYATEGVHEVQAETAQALGESDQAALAKQLTTALGGPIALSVKHTPSLRGGLRLRINDTIIDGSLSGQLERIRALAVI